MPNIYLSPSLQQFNLYAGGGNEEYYMNLIADAMEPYLRASGIQFTRNRPDQTLSQVIAESNAGNYDLHLALHSNAAPPNLAGLLQGTDVYYYPQSAEGMRAAEIIAENFKEIYPDPNLVKTVGTTSLAEVVRVRAPSVLVEIAYHDNLDDAAWIRNNINRIARNLVFSLTEFFDIPFRAPRPVLNGTVATQSTSLNIRSRPNDGAPIVGKIPKGARVAVTGESQGWYAVNYNGVEGYANGRYITLD